VLITMPNRLQSWISCVCNKCVDVASCSRDTGELVAVIYFVFAFVV